jgi:AraC-like DNA-binding protein
MMWVAVLRSHGEADSKASCSLQLPPDDARFFEMLCRRLYAAEDNGLFNSGLLYLFRQAGAITAGQHPVNRRHPAVVKAVRAMAYANDAICVESIARYAGMSRSQLSRLFKKQTGFTLVEYRQKIQMERFLLLYNEGRNLLEAALGAGFGSYPQFYRVFQQRFGCSPRTYFSGKKD